MLLDNGVLFCQLQNVKSAVFLALFLTLSFAASCYNFSQVIIGGQTYYIDGDCYARMTRVRMVLERPGRIIRHHDFENYPEGVLSHTTAPLDYLIAGLKKVLDFGFGVSDLFSKRASWTADTTDLAGAFISPLLGLLTAVFIWFWSKQAKLPFRGALLFLFAVSPVLGHCFLFGRPNHHALQMLLMAVALGAEWMLWEKSSRNWSIVGGIAFGLGIWVSLYEPLILCALVLLLRLVFHRKLLVSRDGATGLCVCVFILALFLLVEGVTVEWPGPAVRDYFKPWVGTVGEMRSATPLSLLLYQWVGLTLLLTPVLFALAFFRGGKKAPAAFALLAVLYALTLWQIRWGYFFALYFVMTLPLQMAALHRELEHWAGVVFSRQQVRIPAGLFARALVWTLFVIALWPVARAWDEQLFPSQEAAEELAKQRLNALLMRDAAEHLKSGRVAPIMAPWWTCPALAYWSGEPAVAGSSHESLPGIVDSARFYLTDDLEEARAILRKRRSRWVVVYEGESVLENSSKILSQSAPPDALGAILYSAPSRAPGFLTFAYQNSHWPYYKIYRVETGKL